MVVVAHLFMKRSDIIKLIPFSIAITMTTISIVEVLLMPESVNEHGQTVTYSVADQIVYAAFGQIIVLIFIIQNRVYWKHVFAVVLLVAMTGFIAFRNSTFFIGIGLLKFEVTALGLLIAHLFLNKKVVDDLFTAFKTGNLSEGDRVEIQIESFEKKFANKEKNELLKIANSKTLDTAAIEAAKRLLKKQ